MSDIDKTIAWKTEEPATQAARDVLAERKRQKIAEGWTEEHDDAHVEGELASAAGCYALLTTQLWREATYVHGRWKDLLDQYWPWDRTWWKPKNDRDALVKAGALILAEIERLDRVSSSKGEDHE
jgi:hypothetical protein